MWLCESDESRSSIFFSSRRRHTRFDCDWSSDVCSSDLKQQRAADQAREERQEKARQEAEERRLKAEEKRQQEEKEHREKRSEERRVGKECRSRWSPYH